MLKRLLFVILCIPGCILSICLTIMMIISSPVNWIVTGDFYDGSIFKKLIHKLDDFGRYLAK